MAPNQLQVLYLSGRFVMKLSYLRRAGIGTWSARVSAWGDPNNRKHAAGQPPLLRVSQAPPRAAANPHRQSCVRTVEGGSMARP